MSRFLRQAVSSLTIVGYLLVVTWGPAWHEHHHGHCHSHAGHSASLGEAAHTHAGCCSHHPGNCCEVPERPLARSAPADSPCESPLHDDDCIVCQMLAHPPLAPPAIELVEAGEPVAAWISTPVPAPAWWISPVYDSRGPPAV